MNSKNILITGASGFIGSHTCVELLNAGYDVVGIDNLSNSDGSAIAAVKSITAKNLSFHQMDIRDRSAVGKLLRSRPFSAVIHFAGLKAVGESNTDPLRYYQNNVGGTLELLDAMQTAGLRKMIFSSSATVYGAPESVPISESASLSTTNPYGRSKLITEHILGDLVKADPTWRFGVLRYFNPVGAHVSGLIGEKPNGVPNNLMPNIAQVADGTLPQLTVFGNDYPTADGTGVRDYIHVVDLALGHIAALERLDNHPGSFTVNLGTGNGYSVLEMIKAFEKASGRDVPYQIANRREGDIAECFTDPTYASELLNWQAKRTLDEMCQDHWNWQYRSMGIQR